MRNNQCSILVGVLVILALSALVQIYYSKNMTMVGFIHNLTGINLEETVPKDSDTVTEEKFNNYKIANKFNF
tara:strand:- start:1450 stop:1665 length:216 start_codon:yes stop_codon:yes gene_type:complete